MWWATTRSLCTNKTVEKVWKRYYWLLARNDVEKLFCLM
jgi:hypothetical protein